jgi:UDP-glucuronate 4-epimerase
MSDERFLVTGAFGCIGTWVVRQLVAEGVAVTAYDVGGDDRRWRLVMSPEEIGQVSRVQADIADLDAVERTLDEGRITNVIHLAALQVPFCRADPPLGARVNVVGTVNVLEAVRRRADRIHHVVYASSIAAYDALEEGVEPGMTAVPGTIYGVYKRANEGSAHVYWLESDLPSIGLRPHTVYGPGRDQGMTSTPTTAMLAAAGGAAYRIPFGGTSQFQYAPDAAAAFIAASRSDATGATVHNLPGEAVHMDAVVAAIDRAAGSSGTVTHDDAVLPFPEEVESESLEATIGPLPQTSFADGVADSVARFRALLAAGVVTLP